ncbi:MAG TPA: response regulator, partial [Myxococcota bacterium]
IPILFLTAHMVDEKDIITGYGAGGVDYLTKPLNPQILRQKVLVFAELFRKTRALAELNERLEERVRERTEELAASAAQLRAAARQKDEFLAVLAHELRNPLAPLRTGVDLLKRNEAAQQPKVARTLAAMDRQVDHLVRLIDDLLDVSRINNGVLELKREEAELGAIVESAIETLRGSFDKKSLVVQPNLGVAHANVDPTRLAQIVGNLLHNASKFTRTGGHVRVTLDSDGTNARIIVVDDGVGIPPDQLGRVFDMFARVERNVPSGDRGAGIGLALARRLAEMHGGSLTAFSEGESKGTAFTLIVPLSHAATSDAPTTPLEPARSEGAALDIVLIEDSPDVAETLAAWLEDEGHRVHTANDGESGVELVLAQKPTVVLCDIGLPGIDGVEVGRRIRSRADWRPTLIALTGWGQKEDVKRTTDAGFDQHLVKPVEPAALSRLLRQLEDAHGHRKVAS